MVKASRPGGHEIRRQRQHHHRHDREGHTKGKGLALGYLARRNRPPTGAFHHPVDIRVPPHVQRARGTAAHGNEQDRRQTHDRVHAHGRGQQTHKCGEHHKRHHPRLEQGEKITETGIAGLRCGGIQAYVAHRRSSGYDPCPAGDGQGRLSACFRSVTRQMPRHSPAVCRHIRQSRLSAILHRLPG